MSPSVATATAVLALICAAMAAPVQRDRDAAAFGGGEPDLHTDLDQSK